MYQVLVDYFDARGGVWRSPAYDEADVETARRRYAEEAGRMCKGGIRAVYLTRYGVVVAQSQYGDRNAHDNLN